MVITTVCNSVLPVTHEVDERMSSAVKDCQSL